MYRKVFIEREGRELLSGYLTHSSLVLFPTMFLNPNFMGERESISVRFEFLKMMLNHSSFPFFFGILEQKRV